MVLAVFAASTAIAQSTADEAQVRAVVERFGGALKDVSLLAPRDGAARSIRRALGPYVSPTLIKQWTDRPRCAPGRAVSSPWPERIDITAIDELEPGAYRVTGSIVLLTSVEAIRGGVAGLKPVSLTVERLGTRWQITEYESGPNISP